MAIAQEPGENVGVEGARAELGATAVAAVVIVVVAAAVVIVVVIVVVAAVVAAATGIGEAHATGHSRDSGPVEEAPDGTGWCQVRPE